MAGCAKPEAKPSQENGAGGSPPAAVAAAESLLPPEATPKAEEFPHLHNLLHLTPRIYSGGEPHGDESFAELATLGVKTIVSVDGAKPDVAAAQKHGLRYIHIPIGYDGVDDEATKSLTRVVRETEGPIYFHCHHGKHRGPAAAAVACVAAGTVKGKEAHVVLERAGTSKDYAGLWRDVEQFKPPPPDAKLPELVEVAQVGSMAAAMAQIDRAKDNLALAEQERWSVPKDHPDIAPQQEALILREALHETGRNLSGDYDERFQTLLSQSEQIAIALEAALKENRPEAASGEMVKLMKSCKECHANYRD
jgi:protein tyrosine phosphatase (PTP) superfamily phosphohydrolase (DUF442 family)